MDDLDAALRVIEAHKFWARVEKAGPNDCWPWTRSLNNRGGYGQLRFMGEQRLAHRVAYELTNGPIPAGNGYHGTVIRHKCDNPKCCNPAHLEIGTQKDNVRDMVDRGRMVNNTKSGEEHGNAILTNAQREAIKADPRGHSEVGREYGVSPQVIFYVRNKWNPGLKYGDGRSRTSKGSTNPNSRLTEDDVRAIRASDEKPGILAKRFGILPDYVTMIRKRKAWRHVD